MTEQYCNNCGELLDDDSIFCMNCGTKVGSINEDENKKTSSDSNSNKEINNYPMYPFSIASSKDDKKALKTPKNNNNNINSSSAGNKNVSNRTTKSNNKNLKSSLKKYGNASNQITKSQSFNTKSNKQSNVKISNFIGENKNIVVVDKKGPFTVIEYERDLSLTPREAMVMYFSSKMNIRPRQLVVDLSKTSGICLQSGSLQWMSGENKISSGITGVGDFGKKFVKSKITGESTVKPEYAGDGYVVTDKTYKHLLILDLDDFDNNLMIDDGLFLAAEKSVDLTIKARTNLSSAIASNEGLFNTVLKGHGFVCLESRVPFKEIIILELNNDTVSIDGSMAIAWTSTLELTVEKSAKTLVGSAISREGFVNVYRGTGKILVAPLTDVIDIRDLPTNDPTNHGIAHMMFK